MEDDELTEVLTAAGSMSPLVWITSTNLADSGLEGVTLPNTSLPEYVGVQLRNGPKDRTVHKPRSRGIAPWVWLDTLHMTIWHLTPKHLTI